MRILKIKFLEEKEEKYFCQRCYDTITQALAKDTEALNRHYLNTQVTGIWDPKWTEILHPMEPPEDVAKYVCETCGTNGKELTECRSTMSTSILSSMSNC